MVQKHYFTRSEILKSKFLSLLIVILRTNFVSLLGFYFQGKCQQQDTSLLNIFQYILYFYFKPTVCH